LGDDLAQDQDEQGMMITLPRRAIDDQLNDDSESDDDQE